MTTNHDPMKGWAIDTSTGTPILTYEACSVIQDEQAHLVMRLLQDDSLNRMPPGHLGDYVVQLRQENTALTREVETVRGHNRYLESRQIEMQQGWDACHGLADLRSARIATLEEALEVIGHGACMCEGREWRCNSCIARAALAPKEAQG